MKLPLLVLSLLLALPASAAPKISAEHKILFFGQDDRVRTRPDHQPWLAVGQLQTRSRTICTGALVAPDVVLTAGHCFIDEKAASTPRSASPSACGAMNTPRAARCWKCKWIRPS